MTDPELSLIFNHHAFDPWHPDNRGRDCSVVMDLPAFLAAVAEFSKQDVEITHTGDDMSDQELDSMWHMARPYFRAAVREAIAAQTRELVDALRAFLPGRYPLREDQHEAARLVAEYDAAQKGPTPCQ